MHDLRRRLGVDSGYLSRMLRRLEGDNLIALDDDPADGRRRVASLTATGRREWDELDRRSELIAHRLLESLNIEQQAELTAALRTADRLLRLATISMSIVEPDSPGALMSMRAYFAELDERFPTGFNAGDDFDAQLDAMRAPSGGFVVVDDGGEPVGCGGLVCIEGETVEIKRMWLDASLRGLGVGKQLLARLEARASDLGYRVVVLDTNAVLTRAISMYEHAGYGAIERYNDNPYAQHWFRKELP